MVAGKTSLLIAALAAFVGMAHAAEQGRWQPLADRPDCRVWNASPETDETAAWSGPCKDGYAHGNGTLTWRYSADGERREETYVGDMGKGRLHGLGVFTWPNGDRFEGHWQDDKANGHGVAVWADGARYEGGWRADKRHGYGVYMDANGDRYEGEWKDGYQNGQGVYVWADGERYEGGWKDDRPNGTGVWHDRHGDTYRGTWTKGCFEEGGRFASIGTTAEACGFD